MKALLKKILSKETRLLARRAYYFGNRHSCNVCGANVRTMFTSGYTFPVLDELDVIGGETVPDDVCPICFGHCRVRLLSEYLERESGIYDGGATRSVLHFAPEYGIAARLMRRPGIDYHPVDFDPSGYADVDGIAFCDVTDIRHPDNTFDLIICSHVLEHIPDDRRAMRELSRVLKPGGVAILQVPISTRLSSTIEDPNENDPRERERRFGQNDHVRIYGPDYPARLETCGFDVSIFDPAAHWTDHETRSLRLNPREKIYLATKRAAH